VFSVRYEPNSYILFRRNSVFKGLQSQILSLMGTLVRIALLRTEFICCAVFDKYDTFIL
jgi:hypothetical protein